MKINKILIFYIILLLAGCTNANKNEIIDRAGRTVIIKNQISRVISTAPSNTEIIADLGQAHKLIAVDKHSANIEGIHENLTLLDFFFPDAEAIINLAPDLIIASGHNTTGSGEDPFRILNEIGIPVVYISMSKSIEDIYLDIAFIAELLQAKSEGEALVNLMRTQVNEFANAANAAYAADAAHTAKKTVYFEMSAAPLMMTFGNESFINDMIFTIGAINIFANERWLVQPDAETVINRNPDIILTNVNYIDNPIEEIKNRPGFNHINAVRNNRIYLIDTDSSVRPSARIVLAMRQMQEAVYPELYE